MASIPPCTIENIERTIAPSGGAPKSASARVVNHSEAQMRKRKWSTLLNVMGLVSAIAGLSLLLYPALSLRLSLGASLIILGSFCQSKFGRFDVYGITYGKWLEDKIRKIIPAEMSSSTNLGGRRLLSTIVNLLGIPILVVGIYLTWLPSISVRYGVADLLLIAGIYLQVKYRAFIGSSNPKATNITPVS